MQKDRDNKHRKDQCMCLERKYAKGKRVRMNKEQQSNPKVSLNAKRRSVIRKKQSKRDKLLFGLTHLINLFSVYK